MRTRTLFLLSECSVSRMRERSMMAARLEYLQPMDSRSDLFCGKVIRSSLCPYLKATIEAAPPDPEHPEECALH